VCVCDGGKGGEGGCGFHHLTDQQGVSAVVEPWTHSCPPVSNLLVQTAMIKLCTCSYIDKQMGILFGHDYTGKGHQKNNWFHHVSRI